jgi:hypothetical protein
MLEDVPLVTFSALAGVTARGRDASTTAAVPAMERLMRLGISTEVNKEVTLDLPISYANSSALTNHPSRICKGIASGRS